MGVWYFPSLWVSVPMMHGYRHWEPAIKPISPYSKTSHLIDFLLRGKRANDRRGLSFILVWYQTNTLLTWCIVINLTSVQNPAAFIWCLAWSKFLGRFSRIRASHPNVPSLSLYGKLLKKMIYFSPQAARFPSVEKSKVCHGTWLSEKDLNILLGICTVVGQIQPGITLKHRCFP